MCIFSFSSVHNSTSKLISSNKDEFFTPLNGLVLATNNTRNGCIVAIIKFFKMAFSNSWMKRFSAFETHLKNKDPLILRIQSKERKKKKNPTKIEKEAMKKQHTKSERTRSERFAPDFFSKFDNYPHFSKFDNYPPTHVLEK